MGKSWNRSIHQKLYQKRNSIWNPSWYRRLTLLGVFLEQTWEGHDQEKLTPRHQKNRNVRREHPGPSGPELRRGTPLPRMEEGLMEH